MLRRCLLTLTLAATILLLAAGCQSVSTRMAQREEDRDTMRMAEAHARYASGVLHDLNDEAVLALDDYYAAALLDPADEDLTLEVSRRFLLNKQPEKALEILTHAVEEENASGAVYGRLGVVYSQLGQMDLAVTASRTAIKREPKSLVGYQNLFVGYIQNKDFDKALAALDEAARVQNVEGDFLTGLTELYLNFGMQNPSYRTNANAKGKVVLARALKLKPLKPELQLRIADDFSLLNDREHAAEMYRELVKLPRLDPDLRDTIRAKLADIYMRGQNQERAMEQLQDIIRDDPANARVYYSMGSIAFDQNQMTNAADYFAKTILLRPDFEPAYYDLASAQINMDQPLTALTTLSKARSQRFADNFMIEYLTGVVNTQQTNYSEALKNFTTAEIVAEAKEPQRLTATFYFQIGATCERLGKTEDAEKYFEKSLLLRPNDDETLNYLGFMWADKGVKLNQAKDYIAKALQAEPNNAAYLDSMGWVMFKLGKPREALDYMLRAVAASEEPDAELLNHLGDVHAALNQTDKAREAWEKSNGIAPNDAVQKKLAPKEKK